jgi:KipI family sensor histidine kinase inhibitor
MPVVQPSRRTLIYPRFAPVGESALTVEFDDVIDPAVNARVRALDRAIAASNLPGIIETVPSFRSLLIIYEPEVIGLDELTGQLTPLLGARPMARINAERSWTIPVAYGFPTDDDLRQVSDATGLSRDEVIGLHSGAEYQVFLIGFVPGLPVLGGLPPALHVPRRPDPRPSIPAGRVMIGGMQGIILPMAMPTGYHILGQTPLRPYNRGAENPFLFRAGDHIRFRPITARELDALAWMPSDHFLNGGAH